MKAPPLSPQQRVSLLVASYMDSYKRAGVAMTPDEVRAQVVADCELVDAAERNGELNKPSQRKPREPRENRLDKAEQETGVRTVDTQKVDVWRPKFMHQSPVKMSERWGYACGRIARIKSDGMEGRDYVGKLGPLAYAYDTLYACFLTRNLPAASRGFQRNPFDGMTDRDAARRFIAETERICDQSTGVLGSWYTK